MSGLPVSSPGEATMYYPGGGFVPQYYYDYGTGGYSASPGHSPEQWTEEYPQYGAGMEAPEGQVQQAPQINENGSIFIPPHQGFTFPPQPSFTPYGPASPSIGSDGQLYGPHFQYPGGMFPQAMPTNGQYPMQGSGGHVGSRVGQSTQIGDNRGHRQPEQEGAQVQQVVPLFSAGTAGTVAVGMHPGSQGPLSLHGQSMAVTSPGVVPIGIVPPYNSFNRSFIPPFSGRGRGASGHGVGGRGYWHGNQDRGKLGRDRGGIGQGNGTGLFDVMNEQNRGPRTNRVRSQREAQVEGAGLPGEEHLSGADFPTSYEAAKFFVIKSYSEDDVHKSIKYNMWASTPNGNRKLDQAYKDASAKASSTPGGCPLFLFFSVNSSGQFCGVAEMIGPVDFTKQLDYWQQDKWMGQFPVKWHIIKDVPNGQFRNIILSNNENKPVTNSRDTQEVYLEQGLEVLTTFKNYQSKTSILEDFRFYDDRERAMQEKRSRQSGNQRQRSQLKQRQVSSGVALSEAASSEAAPEADPAPEEGSSPTPSFLTEEEISAKVCVSSDGQAEQSDEAAASLAALNAQTAALKIASVTNTDQKDLSGESTGTSASDATAGLTKSTGTLGDRDTDSCALEDL